VARLAGLPPIVVERARHLLPTWENQTGQKTPDPPLPPGPQIQLTLFESSTQKAADALLNLDLEHLSPREAIDKLFEIKEMLLSGASGKSQPKA
jgi:DNA mismatch repair protein MutS